MPRNSATALYLLACLLVAACGAARAGADRYGRPETCPTFEGFLRTRLARDKYSWITDRLHMLPRRGGITLLLPTSPDISGPWLRQFPPVLDMTLDNLVREIVLTRRFDSAVEMARAGFARTLSGSRVVFTVDDGNRLVARFEGWAGAKAILQPIPMTLPGSNGRQGATIFGIGPTDDVGSPKRRLLKIGGSSCSGQACSTPNTLCSCNTKCMSAGGASSGGSEIFYVCT